MYYCFSTCVELAGKITHVLFVSAVFTYYLGELHEDRAYFTSKIRPGAAAPKRLTTKQRRIVGALVAKHGHDIVAMSRDIKLNKMQHTVAQLRELVVSFLAYPELLQEGGGPLGFRAPKKGSLKGRF